MRTIAALILLLSSLPAFSASDAENYRYLGLRESTCFLFCDNGEDGRNAINLEFGSRLAGENCCAFLEWRVSQTVRTARWRHLFSNEHSSFAYTSAGITATARTPHANLLARVGVFAVGAGDQILHFDEMSEYYELDVGWGVMERFEVTVGFGPGGLNSQVRWYF